MTIRVNAWYRVKTTHQFCVVQRIPSTTHPKVSIQEASENTRGFELALLWYTPADEKLAQWTKRVMIFEVRKALGLLRDPVAEDWPIIDRIKELANSIPVSAASRDGEFTLPQ
jgi:hypothetical protein